jgi:hypothetical protein
MIITRKYSLSAQLFSYPNSIPCVLQSKHTADRHLLNYLELFSHHAHLSVVISPVLLFLEERLSVKRELFLIIEYAIIDRRLGLLGRSFLLSRSLLLGWSVDV